MVEHGDIDVVMTARRGRPLLIVDIAVPRDVDPGAGRLPGVTLLDMDDLSRFVAVGLEGRRREASRARVVVDEGLERYQMIATAREVAPVVGALHSRAEAVRAAEIQRAASRLAGLDEHERDAVDALTRAIIGKLLHQPTARLTGAAGTARGDRLVEAARDLFDLDD
jgi:glutamyl-tRNA reductase